ncbi:MAG TPA: sulfite exporter TauE/SafE family protein [Caldilineaceae bacterium]|nr:sulfite exporter TauE/SafE family protein [Caldilineaceae bacterium]
MTLVDFIIIGLAAVAGGAVNALAGGGTLITFPVLVAVGAPVITAVSANVTNTVALCPGYFGATLAQAKDLRRQERRLWVLAPSAVLGGVAGGLLLLNTGERVFRELIPYLILLASALLAFQPQMRRWVVQRMQQGGAHGDHPALAVPLIFIASIYGGYFGAGLSVIVLAMLGLVLEDTLTRLNGLKQAISFSVNVAAALFFVFSGEVVWSAAAVMAVGALLGGALGGRLAGQIQPNMLRWLVVTIGVIVAVIYLAR